MGLWQGIKNIFSSSPAGKAYGGLKHSQEKKERRYKREVEKIQEAQKYGLKTQKKQYEIFKDLMRGEYAPETSLKQQRKDFERAQRYAGEILEPQKEAAIKEAQTNYQRFGRPQIVGDVTGGYGGKSSALNQALAAAQSDLVNQLTTQFQGMQLGLTEQLLGRRDLAREQEAKMMMGLVTGQNPIALGVAGTQPVAPPSLVSKLAPAVGAIGGGLYGGAPGAIEGYKIGTGIGQAF